MNVHVRWKRRERYVDRVWLWRIDEDSMPIQQYDDELSSIPTGLSHFVDWFADVPGNAFILELSEISD